MKQAKGRWIAFLDSDDLWMSDKLERQIEFMKKIGIHFRIQNMKKLMRAVEHLNKGVVPRKITKTGMYNYCWPGCLTVMYDRTVVGEIQIADIKKNNDYAMWLKVCKKTECYLYKEVMAKYRKRSGSISNHGYKKLIIWHYKLFHDADNKKELTSFILTMRNLFFGVMKKIIYVERG